MSKVAAPLGLQIKVSLKSAVGVFKRPQYLFGKFIIFCITLGFFVWLGNYSLLFDFLSGNSSFGDKLSFFISGYESLITNYEWLPALMILGLSELFAFNLVLLVYVLRQKAAKLREGGRGAAGIFAGIIGAGCAACGTSLLTPFLTGIGASGSLGLVEVIGTVANIVAIALICYSIFRLGLVAAALK